jgi:hypothetical protein
VKRPYGYQWDKQDKRLYKIEYEVTIVAKMYSMILEGKSHSYVSNRLNANQIPTAGQRGMCRRQVVINIMGNPIYCGQVRFQPRNRPAIILDAKNIDPIIDQDTYIKAQRMIKSRTRGNTRKTSLDKYIFGNVLYCSRCGKKMTTHTTIETYTRKRTKDEATYRTYFYVCDRNRNIFGANRCSQKSVSQIKLEKRFFEYLLRLRPEPDNVEMADEADTKKIKLKIGNLKSELKKLDDRKVKLQMKFVDDILPESDYLNLVKAVNDEINQIKDQISEQNAIIMSAEGKRLNSRQIEEIVETAKKISDNWTRMTDVEKKVFITLHFKKILMDGEEIKSVEYY